MKSFKPVLFGLILAALGYFYFRGIVGIAVAVAFFLIGICVAFLSSEDKKMKDRVAAQKAAKAAEKKEAEDRAKAEAEAESEETSKEKEKKR